MATEALTEAIATLKYDTAEMQMQMKCAGDDREMQNKKFQMPIADQRATQMLLSADAEAKSLADLTATCEQKASDIEPRQQSRQVDREKEYQEFQMTDHHATLKLLTSALNIMII